MELLKTEILREGKHVDFVAKAYRRTDGSEVEREVVEHPGSVAVLRAERWSLLHVIYPSPGFLTERVTIFEATGLSPATGARDDDEEIEIVRLPLAEIDAALPQIRDASTVIALLYLRERLR